MSNPFRTSIRRAVIGLVSTVLFAAPVAAQDYAAPGGYLILGGLNAFQHFSNTGGNDFTDSWGFEMRGGYRMNPFLALEVGGDFLSGFETNAFVQQTGRREALTIDGGNITANAKVHLPWFGRLQPYGMFGLGGQWARLRSTYQTGTVCGPGFNFYWYCTGTYAQLGNAGGFVMKFGGGTDFWITEDWGLTIDATYVMPTGSLEDVPYTNLGWGVKFKF